MTITEAHSQLNHALELLEPLIASMRARDDSRLFLSIAPGLARDIYRLVQKSAHGLIANDCVVGRRAWITRSLVGALRELHRARETAEADRALQHLNAAFRRLAEASASLQRRIRSRSGR